MALDSKDIAMESKKEASQTFAEEILRTRIYLSLLDQPSADTAIATQFTAKRTKVSFLQLFHTNEASKDINESLEGKEKYLIKGYI